MKWNNKKKSKRCAAITFSTVIINVYEWPNERMSRQMKFTNNNNNKTPYTD